MKMLRFIYTDKLRKIHIKRKVKKVEIMLRDINGKKFIESYLGQSICMCADELDFELSLTDEEQEADKDIIAYCRGEWSAYQKMLICLYDEEYHFSRTDDFYGIIKADESEWLYKFNRV